MRRILLRELFLSLLVLLLSVPFYSTNAQQVTIDPISGSIISIHTTDPLTNIYNDPNATNVQLYDDSWAQVPLDFNFPLYDKTFVDSTMYSNGAIQFGPTQGWGANGFCCQGLDLNQLAQNGSIQYNYSLLPLWTDLWTNSNEAYYLGDKDHMIYGWYGVNDYSNANISNAFEVEINKLGNVDFRYEGANTQQQVTIGLTGDLTNNQYIQFHNGYGFNLGQTVLQPESPTLDPCALDPLSSSACQGYAEAYLTQQCLADTLYSTECPGYTEAYYNNQCSLNPLYDTNCSGYTEAYYNNQCSLNPLYDTNCSGYAEAYTITNILIPTPQPFIFSTAIDVATVTGDATLDQLLSITPEVITISDVQQEIVQTITVEDLGGTVEPVSASTQEADLALAEIIQESPTKDGAKKEIPSKAVADKQKAAVAARIEELKKQLTSSGMTKDTQAIQAQLNALIAFVPGFDTYYTVLPDSTFYEQEQAYASTQVQDNFNGLRMGLASEIKFNQLMELQYNR